MRLEWGRCADEDVHHLWMFLAERNVAYADRVEARLKQAAELIGTMPLIGRAGATSETREWSVVDVQYVLEYRVDEDRVLILRVRSTRQNREEP